MHYRLTWQDEEDATWSTDQSVLRAYARDQVTTTDDATKVERHLKRLARSKAANRVGGQIVQKVNKRGQTVTDTRIRVIRGERTDDATGEIRAWKDYRVGYYTGGNGFLSVNDGRVTARDIARILGGSPHDHRADFVLVS